MARCFRLPFLLLLIGLMTCTDPFLIKDLDVERILVVEATLTDEVKRQAIKLSRTIGLVDFGGQIEADADVFVQDNEGGSYLFSYDMDGGEYLSDQAFAAEADKTYTLKIKTVDNHRYSSSPVTLPPTVEIDRVYPTLALENGKEQIQVLVDASNDVGAKYFRYEYEETHQIVLPRPSPFEWRIFNYDNFTRTYMIELTPRRLDLACYQTINSSGIRQTSTIGLHEPKISQFPIHFIDPGDPVVRDRYSILVKQYVQNLESFIFYNTLRDLGNVESLLSQSQPGYVAGNILAEVDPDEKVLGFFEVSSVSSKRIFFNYEDLGLELPPYYVECEHLISHEIGSGLLHRKLTFENYQVFFFEEIPVNGSAPQPVYHISQSECAECPPSSTHIKPEFWEE